MPPQSIDNMKPFNYNVYLSELQLILYNIIARFVNQMIEGYCMHLELHINNTDM